MAHGLDDLDCEAGAADQVAAIFVGALIGAGPEELVDQVAMGAVDLDAVESQALRVRGGLTEGLDNAADMLARHRLRMLEAGLGQAREAGHGQARRAGARQLRMGRLGRVARHTDMPELRHDLAAGLMHRVDDTQPAIERRTAEVRDVDAHGRDGVVDHRAFGDDQARPTFGAPPVVGRDLRAGNAASRLLPGHRRHHDAVGEAELAQDERAEERGDGFRRIKAPQPCANDDGLLQNRI